MDGLTAGIGKVQIWVVTIGGCGGWGGIMCGVSHALCQVFELLDKSRRMGGRGGSVLGGRWGGVSPQVTFLQHEFTGDPHGDDSRKWVIGFNNRI